MYDLSYRPHWLTPTRTPEGVTVTLYRSNADGSTTAVAAETVADPREASSAAGRLVRDTYGNDHHCALWQGRGWAVDFASGYRLFTCS